MDSGRARELFTEYAGAMAYVAVETADGTPSIGSAFHVGDGVFVTARHVVENQRIVEVRMTEHTYVDLPEEEWEDAKVFLHVGDEKRPVHRVDNGVLNVVTGPVFHHDSQVDVAAFRVEEIDARTPFARLGGHLDDWLGATDFVLTEAIVLGYPPIPLTKDVHLVAARAEVNAVVNLYSSEHVRFVLSAMPRGGFSGGLVISEGELVLGVVTECLLADQQEAELGFFAVLSVEPIYVCLSEHKLLPACQAEGWDDFWNLDVEYYYSAKREVDEPTGGVAVRASLGIFDDGERFYLELSCDDEPLFEQAARRAEEVLGVVCPAARYPIHSRMLKLEPSSMSSAARAALDDAARAAHEVLATNGLVAITGREWS